MKNRERVEKAKPNHAKLPWGGGASSCSLPESAAFRGGVRAPVSAKSKFYL